jgi:hypothetical protein
MSNYQYFAQIEDGDVVGLVQVLPEQELKENQIGLTKEEFFFLKSVPNANGNVLEKANTIINSVAVKIGELEKSQ